MFTCGQMYITYIQLWKWPDDYKTNLKVIFFTRNSEEVLETSLKMGFSKSINIITEVIEAYRDFPYNKYKC